MTTPSIGRAVHYVSRGSADGRFPPACRAATVTEVADDDETVGLCVINPTGFFFHALSDGGVEHDEGGELHEDRAPGSWHWPERV